MTISNKHKFHSAKGDPADTTLVRPSNWNDEHDLTMATGKVLGRTTVSAGPVEELAAGTAGLSILAAADADAVRAALLALGLSLPSTGDFKPTLKTTADTGWVMCDDGTIGSAASAASNRANDDTEDLFKLLWTISDTYAPVTDGRGSTADDDWDDDKKISLTKMLGRALAIAGSGSGLTARTLGQTLGEETHALTEAENGPHDHGGVTGDDTPDHTHPYSAPNPAVEQGGVTPNFAGSPAAGTTGGASVRHHHPITSSGDGDAHNNMQPTSFINMMVKL